jgi:hypothetical protein
VCFLIGIYLLYREDSLWQFQIGLYYTLVRCLPPSLPFDPLPTSLLVIARRFIVLFLIGMEVHQPCSFTLISFIHHPLSDKYPHKHTLYLFYSPIFHY